MRKGDSSEGEKLSVASPEPVKNRELEVEVQVNLASQLAAEPEPPLQVPSSGAAGDT